MAATTVCPFCFHRIDSSRLWFQCLGRGNAECKKSVDEARKKLTKSMRETYPTFPPPEKVTGPAKCPECGGKTNLRACPECREELVSTVVATGVLRAAARAEQTPAPQAPAQRPPAELPAPKPSLAPRTSPDPRTSSAQKNSSAQKLPFTPPTSSNTTAPPDPETSETPEWLTRISRDSSRPHRRRPHHRRRLAAIAAGVVILAGAAAAALGLAGSGPAVLTRAALHPLQAPAGASGKVTVSAASGSRDVQISTVGLPAPGQGHYYEVWLLDPATLKMMPMGALPPSGQASFSVATGLTAGYSAVDISLQANNGNPAHSKVSVLRGSLRT